MPRPYSIQSTLFLDLYLVRHLDALARDDAAIGNGLNARGAGNVEGLAVGGIDVAGKGEALCRADLDEKQHDRAMAGRAHGGKLRQVSRATAGDGIGEF